MKKIKLKCASMTRFGRLPQPYLDLFENGVRPLLDRVDPSRVKRVYFSSFAPTELCGIEEPVSLIADRLRALVPGLRAGIAGPFMTGGEALHAALEECTGSDGDALIVSCEKMTHRAAGEAAGLLAPRSNPVEKLYNATLPALGALVTRSYMRSFAVPYEAFHRVAVKNHRNAARNPKAHFQTEIGVADVASSPLVADPLRRHHCAPMSDGAAACLIGDGRTGIGFRGWGHGTDTPLFHERADVGRFPAARIASRAALNASGLGVSDIDVVEIHDAFSPFELINLEEMGFFPLGTAWRALEDGDLEIGGRLAVNPSGGMKARGHPIGVCGLSSVVEMYDQLTGAAGPRQHRGASLGMIQSAGGVSRDAYAFVLGAD